MMMVDVQDGSDERGCRPRPPSTYKALAADEQLEADGDCQHIHRNRNQISHSIPFLTGVVPSLPSGRTRHSAKRLWSGLSDQTQTYRKAVLKQASCLLKFPRKVRRAV